MEGFPPIFVISVLWLVWCGLHSLLISRPATDRLRMLLRERFALYRLFFVLFSVVTLLPVLWYQRMAPQTLLFAWHGAWRPVQGLLLVYAGIVFVGGALVYDLGFFLGIRQWQRYAARQPLLPPVFAASGILRYVRHPWYSGAIAFVWAVGPVTDVTLAAKVVASLYLVAGTVLEERKLVSEIGEPYRLYRKRVPMLIPWKGRCRAGP